MIEYRKKYIKVYLWQALSILLGFASLFIVVPHLSSEKMLYGIFSVCTSLTIFFSYADLGFLSSGNKYAAEYYIKGDYHNEVKVIGFTAFFMISTFMLIDIGILVIGFKPTILIPELIQGSNNYHVAQSLIFILAIGCPLIIAQRVLQLIFMIRVEDYKYQRITIVGNMLRIISVFVFFSGERYLIVEYYLFYQLVSVLIIILSVLSIRRYGYKIKDFLKAFKFDKYIFHKEKALSFSSLLFLVSMILYNELDQIAISNMFNVESVALYATAYSIMTFIRTFCGLVYSPYTSRYNHYVGLKDEDGLILFTKKMVLFFCPILVLPIFNIALYSEPLVVSWVGHNYSEAAVMMSFMVMSYALTSITQPLTCYMTASEKNKKIVTGALFLPLCYWIGIIILSKFMGVSSFAVMKFVAPMVVMIYYWLSIRQDIISTGNTFIKIQDLAIRLIPAMIFAYFFHFFLSSKMFYIHKKTSLMYNILFVGTAIICSLVVAILFSKEMKKEIKSFIDKKIK